MLSAQKFNPQAVENITKEEFSKGTLYAGLFGASMLTFLAVVYIPVLLFALLFGGGLIGMIYLAVRYSQSRKAAQAPLIRPTAHQEPEEDSWVKVTRNSRERAPRVRRPTFTFRSASGL